jgi:hypothetical protein
MIGDLRSVSGSESAARSLPEWRRVRHADFRGVESNVMTGPIRSRLRNGESLSERRFGGMDAGCRFEPLGAEQTGGLDAAVP